MNGRVKSSRELFFVIMPFLKVKAIMQRTHLLRSFLSGFCIITNLSAMEKVSKLKKDKKNEKDENKNYIYTNNFTT